MSLRAIIQQIVREQLPVQVFPATVTSVNRAEACFDAQPIDTAAPELFDVRLRAVDDDTATGLIIWPKEGSVVLIGLINNDLNTAFMVAASEAESFTMATAEQSLLTILQDLVTALQQLTVPTPSGVSGLPINLAALQDIARRLPLLLTA
jgi:hypothetical protein